MEPSNTAQAQEAEATGKPITVEYAGETYTLICTEDTKDTNEVYEAIETFEQGRILLALQKLLGDDYVKFKKRKPKPSDGAKLFRAVVEALALDLGEFVD